MEGLKEKNEGNKAFQNGDYRLAVDWYSKAISLNPGESTYYSNRSAAFVHLSRFGEALEDARKCIQLKPDWYKGHFRMGMAFKGLGQLAQAVKSLQTSKELSPSHDSELDAAFEKVTSELEAKLRQDESRRMNIHPSVLPTRDANTSFTRAKGPQISTMEDYMRFKAAGGSKMRDNESSYLAELPEEFAPKTSKEEFLRTLGIEHDFDLSTKSQGPNGTSVANDTNKTQPITPQNKSSTLQEALAAQRAALGLQGDYAKMRASDKILDEMRTGAEDAPRVRRTDSQITTPSSREEFIASMGLDMRGASTPSSTVSSKSTVADTLGRSAASSLNATPTYSAQSSPAMKGSANTTVPDALDNFRSTNNLPELPKFDYKAAGVRVGEGQGIREQMLRSFKERALDTSSNAEQIKSDYKDFSYRKYKDANPTVNLTIVQNAILAEALGEYNQGDYSR